MVNANRITTLHRARWTTEGVRNGMSSNSSAAAAISVHRSLIRNAPSHHVKPRHQGLLPTSGHSVAAARREDLLYDFKAAFGRGRLRAARFARRARRPTPGARSRQEGSRQPEPGTGQRQQQASREARSRGAPPTAIRGRRSDAGLSERQVRAVSCPRVPRRATDSLP